MTDPDLQKALRLLDAGDWNGAHCIVQDRDDSDAAWIHAHLHCIEGDLANAAYWYRRAGKPMSTESPDAERARISAIRSR